MAATKIDSIRNIAIIAHVDHGKTTLVDAMLKQAGTFHAHAQVDARVMDSNALEKERGITILSKHTAIRYKDHRINIVDTPGHADFGGEVERILKMVDGVLLIVDAFDGPMPQTRFVLHKALDLGLTPLVVVNKVDREDARPEKVQDMVLDLFIELGADDDQIDFPVYFASAREGYASRSLDTIRAGEATDILPLLDGILDEVPAPFGDPDAPLQLLISNIVGDAYLGRLGIGRVERGTVHRGETVAVGRFGEDTYGAGKIVKLMRFEGLERAEIEEASVGEIVAVAGMSELEIGDTVADREAPEPLPFIDIDEPTISMTFAVNDSPLAGTEGKYLTSRHLRDRLVREMESNVAMRLEETDTPDAFVVKGRGELHLSILIETMRREGYEFQVSKPEVITKEIDGCTCEPVEALTIHVPEDYMGIVIESLSERKAAMTDMKPPERGMARLEFTIPSRGLIGYRSQFLTETKGNGTMFSLLDGFQPWQGEIETRNRGVLVATEGGESVSYGLYHAQDRGELFIGPGEKVYEGMAVGRTPKRGDIPVNVCKKKHVTNMRAAGSDEALRLVPPVLMSLEQWLEFVEEDEWVEVTPANIRLRKKILDTDQRAKLQARKRREQEDA